MKRINLIALVALTFLAVLAAGCVTAPIYNVENAPVSATHKVTMDQVGDAIVRAGTSRGWIMKRVKPGHVVGTLQQRGLMAQVDITYNSKSYSINYKDSQGLKHDGDQIHKHYNSWVDFLDQSIRSELAQL